MTLVQNKKGIYYKIPKTFFYIIPSTREEVLPILQTVICMSGKENNKVISCKLGRTSGENLTFTLKGLTLSLLMYVCSGKSLLVTHSICSAVQ